VYRDSRRKAEIYIDPTLLPFGWDPTWNQWKHLVGTKIGVSATFVNSGKYPQLMTYCVLVEDTLARPVPYGVLQYSDSRRQIPYTAERKREVLQLADEIRRKRGLANVHRQHQHIGRCRKCGSRACRSLVENPRCVERMDLMTHARAYLSRNSAAT
jgi:hypothetical protein